MKRHQYKAQCLICGYRGTVLHRSKEDYQEVTVCLKCNGAFVDVWKMHKYLINEKPSMTNRPDMPVTEKKRCSNLSEKQIVYLEQMINNRRNRGMAVCHCDVQRVLDMCKGM